MSVKNEIYIKEKINSIKAFRKENMKQCVNTQHTFKDNEYFIIAKELRKRFKTFTVDFKKDTIVVTIPTFRRRI